MHFLRSSALHVTGGTITHTPVCARQLVGTPPAKIDPRLYASCFCCELASAPRAITFVHFPALNEAKGSQSYLAVQAQLAVLARMSSRAESSHSRASFVRCSRAIVHCCYSLAICNADQIYVSH